MAVALVRPHANFLAISESGNISLNSLFAWSLDKKAICLAMNMVHKDSALVVVLLMSRLKKDDTDLVAAIAFPASLCRLVLI